MGRVPGKQFSPEDGQLYKHELHQHIHQSQTKVSLVRLFLSCLSKLSQLQCQWTYEEMGQVECRKILWVLLKSFSNCTNFNPVSAWLHTLLGFPRASRSAAWAQECTKKQTHTHKMYCSKERPWGWALESQYICSCVRQLSYLSIPGLFNTSSH